MIIYPLFDYLSNKLMFKYFVEKYIIGPLIFGYVVGFGVFIKNMIIRKIKK